jgi:hypothetical protein
VPDPCLKHTRDQKRYSFRGDVGRDYLLRGYLYDQDADTDREAVAKAVSTTSDDGRLWAVCAGSELEEREKH